MAFHGGKRAQFFDGGCIGLCVDSGFTVKDCGSRFAFGHGVCPACVGFACDGAFESATVAACINAGTGLFPITWGGPDFPVPLFNDGIVFVEGNVLVRVGSDQGQVFQGGVMDDVHDVGFVGRTAGFRIGWCQACRRTATRFDGVRDGAVPGVWVGVGIGCRACCG